MIDRFIKMLLIVFGVIFLILGVSALVLPLLPATPFILLAAACFARSSKKFYDWLINLKYFGPHIRSYYDGRGLPLHMKMFFILFFAAMMGLSGFFFTSRLWIKSVMAVVTVALAIYVFSIKTSE